MNISSSFCLSFPLGFLLSLPSLHFCFFLFSSYQEWYLQLSLAIVQELWRDRKMSQNYVYRLLTVYSIIYLAILHFIKYSTCLLSHFSCVWLFATPWIVACQAPLSMGFCRQEYWRGVPCPPPGDHPDSGIEPMSFTSPTLAAAFFTTASTWKAQLNIVLKAKSIIIRC